MPTLSPMFLQTERGPAAGMPEHVVEARKKRFAANPPGEGPRRMAEAGVKMAFGTDAGSPCVPHDEILAEMQKLIEVGVAKRPLDVIQMLTVNSAELLGESANFGTVEAGKYADLRPRRREPGAEHRRHRQCAACLPRRQARLRHVRSAAGAGVARRANVTSC